MTDTMATERRARQEIRTNDAIDVVNEVLSYEQSPEPHRMETMTAVAHRALETAGYNGWTNYETWAMALWIDNDQGTYTQSREMAREALENHEARTGYGATAEGSLAHYLKEWMEEGQPELPASVWSDLMSVAFQAVDWYEIAENYIEEVQNES